MSYQVSFNGKLRFKLAFPLDASREEIEKQVEDQMRIFGKNGGYVFTTVHNIQANVPVDNILKTFEAANKYRHYSN